MEGEDELRKIMLSEPMDTVTLNRDAEWILT